MRQVKSGVVGMVACVCCGGYAGVLVKWFRELVSEISDATLFTQLDFHPKDGSRAQVLLD